MASNRPPRDEPQPCPMTTRLPRASLVAAGDQDAGSHGGVRFGHSPGDRSNRTGAPRPLDRDGAPDVHPATAGRRGRRGPRPGVEGPIAPPDPLRADGRGPRRDGVVGARVDRLGELQRARARRSRGVGPALERPVGRRALPRSRDLGGPARRDGADEARPHHPERGTARRLARPARRRPRTRRIVRRSPARPAHARTGFTWRPARDGRSDSRST